MKRNVLIIDDDTWLAELWQQYLVAAGFSTRVVKDGFAGIDACDDRIPHVIILDVLLPVTNGVAFLHELRSHHDLAHVPVIVVSSATLDKKNLTPYGVIEVFDKATVTPKQLVDAVKQVRSL